MAEFKPAKIESIAKPGIIFHKYHKKYVDLLIEFEQVQKQNENLTLENAKLVSKIDKYNEILSSEIEN